MSKNPTTLPQVVKELVERILEGDCLRVSGSAGDFYYVVGQKAQEQVDESPKQRLQQPDVEALDSFATWFTRRQVAVPPIDQVAAVQKRLIARGIPSEWLERILRRPAASTVAS